MPRQALSVPLFRVSGESDFLRGEVGLLLTGLVTLSLAVGPLPLQASVHALLPLLMSALAVEETFFSTRRFGKSIIRAFIWLV